MMDVIYSTPFFAVLLALAGVSLLFAVRAIAQSLRGRRRIYARLESDGSQVQALEARLRKVTSAVDLFAQIVNSNRESTVIEKALATLEALTGGELCAIVSGEESWIGPDANAHSDLAQSLRERMRHLQEVDAHNTGDSHTLIEPIKERPVPSWLLIARGGDLPAFTADESFVVASLATMIGVALGRIEGLRTNRELEEITHSVEATFDRAKELVSHYEHIDVAGSLVHHLVRELTPPLTGVLGLAWFLDQQADLPHREDMAMLREEAMRCRRILEHFGAVSLEGEAGAQNREVVDVTRAVRELTASLGSMLKERHVELESHTPREGFLLNTNPTTFGRVLTDMILAGVEKLRETGGRIRLALSEIGDRMRIELVAGPTDCEPDAEPETTTQLHHDLWKRPETLNLAVLQSLASCLGAKLDAWPAGDRLQLRVELETGRTSIPLRAGLLADYRAIRTSETKNESETTNESEATEA